MTFFWSAWVWFWTLGMLFSLSWVLYANYKDGNSTKDHHRRHEKHDGIGEAFAPIPKWWAYTMGGTIIFAFLYLFLFPGLGLYKGVLGWSSAAVLAREQEKLNPKTDQVFADYAKVAVADLIQDDKAMQLGARIFSNNCQVCHNKGGMGQKYFPNLTDHDWLYGGTEEAIKYTLNNGRKGAMPSWSGKLSETEIQDVANYVRHFSQPDVHSNANGERVFKTFCSACHGQNAKGNQSLGAPNLTDDIWLYGGTNADVKITLNMGRNGHMPSQKHLGDDRIHVLTAYIMSLSAKPKASPAVVSQHSTAH